MYCYPGALHMHTIHSDGTGTVADLVQAAHEAGLRWIIITDHDTLAGRPEQGWHHEVLTLVEHEITPDRNHFLALNLDAVVDRTLPPQQFIDVVYQQGGFGIIAHPDEVVKSKFKDIYRWDDWQIDGPTQRGGRPFGIELWNAMSDWGEQLTEWNQIPMVLMPRLGISGPTPATLDWWDQLNQSGKRTFGVAGVDAHAFKRQAPWGEVTVLPYRWIFGTLTNYVVLRDPLSPDAARAKAQIYQAIGEGRLYFANRLLGECPSLSFYAEYGGRRFMMGDTATRRDLPLTFHADMGCDADVQLIYNGRVAARGLRLLRHTVTQAGVYRLEAYRRGRAWVYTNPIYVEV